MAQSKHTQTRTPCNIQCSDAYECIRQQNFGTIIHCTNKNIRTEFSTLFILFLVKLFATKYANGRWQRVLLYVERSGPLSACLQFYHGGWGRNRKRRATVNLFI